MGFGCQWNLGVIPWLNKAWSKEGSSSGTSVTLILLWGPFRLISFMDLGEDLGFSPKPWLLRFCPAAVPVYPPGFPVSPEQSPSMQATKPTLRSPQIPVWALLSASCNWHRGDWRVWSSRTWTTRDFGFWIDLQWEFELWRTRFCFCCVPGWSQTHPNEAAPSSSSHRQAGSDLWGWRGNGKLLKAGELSRTPTFPFILMKKLWIQQGKSTGSNYPKWVA